MKDYTLYTVEDFVSDESYLRFYFRENEEDIRFWTEWIGLHPERLDIVISANNYIDAFSIRIPEAEFQKEQQRFAQALDSLEMQEGFDREDRHTARNRRIGIMVVAALLMVIAGSVLYMTLPGRKVHSGEQEQLSLVEKYVPKGERAKIMLPDGSEVELNADSRLIYPSTFTGPTRELQLSGEAFFRVKRDSLHPFHVISSNLAITVLGTSFNMQSYPDKGQMKVALVTGKVRLDRISDPVNKKVLGETLVLTPSEMGVFNKQDLSLEKKTFDTDEELGWRQGVVVFRDADFPEIADRMDKLYNIRLINRSNKKTFRFKGTFTNSSPEEIVKIICLSKKLAYSTNGNIITIH